MSKNSEIKNRRAEDANQVITAISQHGRRFFYSPANKYGIASTAYFFVCPHGKVYFRDNYTDESIYTAYRGRWNMFSHGGTLKSLVEAIANYIRTGEPIERGYFGPWKDDFCGGDLWGYGKQAMTELREKIKDSPVLAPATVTA